LTAFDYARSKSTAESLLAKFGQTVTLKRDTAGAGPAYNPGAPTTTSYSATAVVLDYSDYERDGTFIQTGDKKVYLSTSGLSITPALSDKMVVNSDTHSIINIKPLNPGGTVLLYEIQIRR